MGQTIIYACTVCGAVHPSECTCSCGNKQVVAYKVETVESGIAWEPDVALCTLHRTLTIHATSIENLGEMGDVPVGAKLHK